MVMTGGRSVADLIYDVTDPLHPRLICSIANTTAHLFTGDTFVYLKPVSPAETDVILHSIGSGNESRVASFPTAQSFAAFTPDGSSLAYTVADESTYTVKVYLFSQGKLGVVHTYGEPIGDCICRFGLPQQVLSFSPDGQYLVDGWVAGKGATPITVIRVADGTTAYTAPDLSYFSALWDHAGHRLFLVGNTTASWTPEAGLATLPGGPWTYFPSISPDGAEAAYSAYPDPNNQVQPRVYLYDLRGGTSRLLVDKLRAEVRFVKDGWVWYDEEKLCTTADQCAGSTTPTGREFAMQLSTGIEQPVTFAPGEDSASHRSEYSWIAAPPEYWPNS